MILRVQTQFCWYLRVLNCIIHQNSLKKSVFIRNFTINIQFNTNRINMPFKHKLLKQIQKCISNQSQNTKAQNQDANQAEIICNSKEKGRNRKYILRKNQNIYQYFLSREPRTCMHIANFFNMIGINQEAIRSDDCQETYCRTIFYLKSVKKIELRPNCLIMYLVSSNFQFPPIQYTISRYKSFGDSKFYKLACLMEEAIIRLKQVGNHETKMIKEESSDFLEKYLSSLGNRMFVCKTSSKLILSRSFLEVLEHNVQDFVIETVKFKTSLHEGCSSERYYDVMIKVFENIRNLIDLLFDRISLQTFLDNSIDRFRDVLYTKNNKKIFAKIKAGMPNPLVTIYEVEQILSIGQQLNQSNYFVGQKKRKVSSLRQEFRNSDVKTLRNLITLPSSYLPENKKVIAGYQDMNLSVKQQ